MRYHVYTEARHPTGAVAAGHSLTVYDDAAGTIESDIYAAESGGSPIANPVTVPATGIVDFWATVPHPYVVSAGDATPRPLIIPAPRNFFNVREFGAAGNGTHDDYAAFMAALAAVYAAGGGTLYCPAGTYRIDSTLRMPDDGAAIPRTVPITLAGSGGVENLYSGGLEDAPNASVLDMRSATGPAKLDSRGCGRLNLRELTFANLGAADTNPFIQVTNTTLVARDNAFWGHASKSGLTCDQDAIVLGGKIGAWVCDGTATGSFAGYGTTVENNFFSRLRRVVYGRTGANACIVRGNSLSNYCGAADDTPAIEFDGTSGDAHANTIQDNIIEVSSYQYAVTLRNSARNVLINNGSWDGTPTATYRLVGSSSGQTILGGFMGGDPSTFVENNDNGYLLLHGSNIYGNPCMAGGQFVVQPGAAVDDDAQFLMTVSKSYADSVDPGQQLLRLNGHGVLELGGATPSVNALTCGLGADGITQSSGWLNLRSGTGGCVYIERGTLVVGNSTTAGRPPWYTVGTGAIHFDTTLNKPIFFDGAKWRDAAGTEV